MQTTIVYGAKGGVGTTTVAAVIALKSTLGGRATMLVDLTGTGDVHAVLGVPGDADHAGSTVLSARLDADTTADHVVIDAGTMSEDDLAALDVVNGRRVLVVRNDYLSLRRAHSRAMPDLVVLISEKDRALNYLDVRSALRADSVIGISHDPAIARRIDAGLLLHGVPQALRLLV